jgi:hypothetical protein
VKSKVFRLNSFHLWCLHNVIYGMTGQIFFYSPYINIIIVVVMKKGVMDACIWIFISISSRLLESETFHHYYLNFLHISTDIFVCLIKNRMMCKIFGDLSYVWVFLSLWTMVWWEFLIYWWTCCGWLESFVDDVT